MSSQKKLEPKQKQFCEEYLIDLNATQAAIRAGYSEKTAKQIGSKLLTKVDIQKKIQELQKERSMRVEISADKVLSEIGKLSFSDIRKLFDENGQLLPIHQLSDDIAAAVSSVEVVTSAIPGTKPVEVEYVSKIKLWDKKGSLELAGKHLKLFTDKTEVTGPGGGPVQIDVADMTAEQIDSRINELLSKKRIPEADG